MTQACSLSSSTADVTQPCESKRLPKGIHIIGADHTLAPRVGTMPVDEALPWGYIFIQHMSASTFEKRMLSGNLQGDFIPKYFIHRTIRYRQKPSGHGVMKEKVPTISGLIFLQGTTLQLRNFLQSNFPQYFLVKDCSTGAAASIPNSVMKPFMTVMGSEPERITFLRDPFLHFAKEHVKLRVLTGLFKGQEGYVVRVNRDRQLIMNLGGYAVAINNVHKEDFEIAE